MITSYEQFKSVTASMFNSKFKTLNELRTAFAKSLGFGSVQALKEKLDSTVQLEKSFISVVEISGGVLQGTTSFRDTPEGWEKATKHLLSLIKEAEGLTDEEDLKAIAMQGSYSSDGGNYNDYYITTHKIQD